MQKIMDQNKRAQSIMQNMKHQIGPQYHQNVQISKKLTKIDQIMASHKLDFTDLKKKRDPADVPTSPL
jgi:hypothetical protein